MKIGRDGGPALDVYVVEGYDDSLGMVPETINRCSATRSRSGHRGSGEWVTIVQRNKSFGNSIS